MQKILIAGGTGFLGKNISRHLQEQGHEVFLLARKAQKKSDFPVHTWNPASKQIDPAILKDKNVIINLSGAGIGDKLWTKKRQKELYNSRIESTRLLIDTLLANKYSPRLFINASAIGYYGNRGEERITENSPAGNGFLSHLCVDWEHEVVPLKNTSTKCAILRIGIVLAQDQGILSKLLIPIKFGFNLIYGSGKHYVSWIHVWDLVQLVTALVNEKLEPSTFNCVSPQVLTQIDLNAHLLHAMKKHAFKISIPVKLLHFLPGEMYSIVTDSQYIVPEELIRQNFHFTYKTLTDALEEIFRK